MTIVVRHRRGMRERFFGFFSAIGDSILLHPNKVFYAILLLLCLFWPLFGIFLLICILCSRYRREYH